MRVYSFLDFFKSVLFKEQVDLIVLRKLESIFKSVVTINKEVGNFVTD